MNEQEARAELSPTLRYRYADVGGDRNFVTWHASLSVADGASVVGFPGQLVEEYAVIVRV